MGLVDAEYGQMARAQLIQRTRTLAAERQRRLASLRSEADCERYIAAARDAVKQAFGPLPERTPLNAETVGETIRGDGFRIENVRFESTPGTFVTANLYLPTNCTAASPAPAVVQPLGHSATAKAATGYQEASQRLAIAGFAVLSLDPINQGERDQYITLLPDKEPVLGFSSPGSARTSTAAHNMMGKQLELCGDWFGRWMLWDGIRAVDYLETRSDVDTSVLGVTGCSGGGTMSSWLWSMEPRFTMAAPNCFVTTFLLNLENENGQDCEQCPPGILGHGLENADLLLATNAGKPLLLTGERHDYFDRRGLTTAYDEIENMYRIMGGAALADKVGLFIGEHTHSFSAEDVCAIAEFFCLHGGLSPPPAAIYGPMAAVGVPTGGGQVYAPELFAANGNVATIRGFIPIPTQIAEKATQLAAARPALSSDALRQKLRQLLGVDAELPQGLAHYRILRPRSDVGSGRYGRYAVETEEGIEAILVKQVLHERPSLITRSLDVEEAIVLLVPDISAATELSMLRPREAEAAYGVDCRGVGASCAGPPDAKPTGYGADYQLHAHRLMLGESSLGRRVYDLRRVMQLLRGLGSVYAAGRQSEGSASPPPLRLVGNGQGALVAAFAALLDEHDVTIDLVHAPLACAAWAEAPLCTWPVSSVLRGMLQHFDLPDVYRALGKRLRIFTPSDAVMAPMAAGAARDEAQKRGVALEQLQEGNTLRAGESKKGCKL